MMYSEVIQWWQGKSVKDSTDLKVLLDNFRVVFACNSNKIEGNTMSYHTTREVFENKPLTSFSGTAREIFEAQNQKFAFEFLLKSFDEHRIIDVNFILDLHKILLYGCYDENRWSKGERPGTFKQHDYCVGVSEVGSFPDEVSSDLDDLITQMNESASEGDVFVKAAYFHLQFESIHPFADGNGRVGRTLLNYYLLTNGYPPIVIFDEDKETYYLGLEVFDKTGELNNFVKFLQEQMVKTWESKIISKELKSLSAFL